MEEEIGRFCRTASGEWSPHGGAWQLQGYDENGLLRSLNGRLTGVHKVLCSAAEIACKGRQDFYLGDDGGYMIPIHSKIGQGVNTTPQMTCFRGAKVCTKWLQGKVMMNCYSMTTS